MTGSNKKKPTGWFEYSDAGFEKMLRDNPRYNQYYGLEPDLKRLGKKVEAPNIERQLKELRQFKSIKAIRQLTDTLFEFTANVVPARGGYHTPQLETFRLNTSVRLGHQDDFGVFTFRSRLGPFVTVPDVCWGEGPGRYINKMMDHNDLVGVISSFLKMYQRL